jgi:hypothetical protein
MARIRIIIRTERDFRVDMSEVDFTQVVLSLPNWSKLPSCIIQYEEKSKKVECL